jgi:hypothetical protein
MARVVFRHLVGAAVTPIEPAASAEDDEVCCFPGALKGPGCFEISREMPADRSGNTYRSAGGVEDNRLPLSPAVAIAALGLSFISKSYTRTTQQGGFGVGSRRARRPQRRYGLQPMCHFVSTRLHDYPILTGYDEKQTWAFLEARTIPRRIPVSGHPTSCK